MAADRYRNPTPQEAVRSARRHLLRRAGVGLGALMIAMNVVLIGVGALEQAGPPVVQAALVPSLNPAEPKAPPATIVRRDSVQELNIDVEKARLAAVFAKRPVAKVPVKPAVLLVAPEDATVEPLGAGEASYYGSELEGQPTASGEPFSPHEMTAAHPTLPFGSIVRVTNTRNGRSVLVRINDRGPFTGERVIDLSKAAAREIGMVRTGTAHVEVEVIKQ